jgi:predicted nucleic-acid-binding protein
MKKPNPHLKRAFLEVVENQLEANDPPETRETLKRLISEGISEDNAKIYIAQAVCVEVYHALKHKQEFNLQRYLKNLKRLPEEPAE